ncbi:MAG: 30S ribosomal protein S2 [Phycisphaerales bacterium]
MLVGHADRRREHDVVPVRTPDDHALGQSLYCTSAAPTDHRHAPTVGLPTARSSDPGRPPDQPIPGHGGYPARAHPRNRRKPRHIRTPARTGGAGGFGGCSGGGGLILPDSPRSAGRGRTRRGPRHRIRTNRTRRARPGTPSAHVRGVPISPPPVSLTRKRELPWPPAPCPGPHRSGASTSTAFQQLEPEDVPFIYGSCNSIHIIDIKETGQGAPPRQAIPHQGRRRRQGRLLHRHQAPGQGRHRATRRRRQDALGHRTLARRHADQLPHHPPRLKRLEELEAIAEHDNFQSYSKKMESQLRREMRKIKRNLDGIRNMHKLPGALVIIDARAKRRPVREARKLGIPTICLLDTDADPDMADIAIPGNDDSMRSIDVVIRELCLAIADGKQARSMEPDAGAQAEHEDEGKHRPRRSSRA